MHFNAIQIIGTQRSGSNLLRLMLNQLPDVFAPHPPHVLHTFYPLLKFYGDLNDGERFKALISDVCKLIELNPVPWDNLLLDRDEVASLCTRRTLLEIFIRIYEVQCKRNNKSVWCCKSMETVYHLHHFDQEGFKPFFIYLYRDGRDVASSFKKIIIGDKHIYFLAQKWKVEQELALQYIEHIPPEAYIKIRYEDMINSPQDYVQEICRKAGVHFDQSAMNYYTSSESKKTAAAGKMWENVSKPILKNNIGKYHRAVSDEDIRLFECIAGDILLELGYNHLESSGKGEIQFSMEDLLSFERENERMKVEAVKSSNPVDIANRKPQSDFLNELRSKLNATHLQIFDL